MSLLTVIRRAVEESGVAEAPSQIIGSTSKDVKQLLAILYRVGSDLLDRPWPSLNREATITLVDSQEAYALPDDFDSQLFNTSWDSNTRWPLDGPYTAQEWSELKNGYLSSSVFRRKYRIKGARLKTFYIDPAPSSDEAGNELTYEYQSTNWIRPKTWTASTYFDAGAWCFYDGYYFKTSVPGVSGSTAPTPSALNDGGITWVEHQSYPAFTADTDEFLVDEDLIGLGLQWNYLAAKGLPYQHLEKKYNRDLDVAFAKNRGSQILDLRGPMRTRNPIANIPEVIP